MSIVENIRSYDRRSRRPAIARRIAFLMMACLFGLAPTLAQNRQAGEIRGTVTDSTGAVIPGAQIVIQDTLTGVVTNLASDSSGVYDAVSVIPGTYTVTFTKEGFKRLVKSNIILHVEAITVNASLEVGAVTQQVTVTSGCSSSRRKHRISARLLPRRRWPNSQRSAAVGTISQRYCPALIRAMGRE